MNRTTPLALAAAATLALLTTGCSAVADALPAPRSAAAAESTEPPAAEPPAAESTAAESTEAEAAAAGPDAAPAAPARPLVATTVVGWGSRGGDAWATGVLENSGDAAATTTVSFTAFGSDGQVLALGRSVPIQVRVGEITAVGAPLDVPKGARVARVTTDLRTAPLASPSAVSFTLAGVNVQREGRRLLGTVATTAPAQVGLTAVCRDDAGSVVGGGTVDAGSLGTGAAATFQIDGMVVSAEPDGCEVFAAVTA